MLVEIKESDGFAFGLYDPLESPFSDINILPESFDQGNNKTCVPISGTKVLEACIRLDRVRKGYGRTPRLAIKHCIDQMRGSGYHHEMVKILHYPGIRTRACYNNFNEHGAADYMIEEPGFMHFRSETGDFNKVEWILEHLREDNGDEEQREQLLQLCFSWLHDVGPFVGVYLVRRTEVNDDSEVLRTNTDFFDEHMRSHAVVIRGYRYTKPPGESIRGVWLYQDSYPKKNREKKNRLENVPTREIEEAIETGELSDIVIKSESLIEQKEFFKEMEFGVLSLGLFIKPFPVGSSNPIVG